MTDLWHEYRPTDRSSDWKLETSAVTSVHLLSCLFVLLLTEPKAAFVSPCQWQNYERDIYIFQRHYQSLWAHGPWRTKVMLCSANTATGLHLFDLAFTKLKDVFLQFISQMIYSCILLMDNWRITWRLLHVGLKRPLFCFANRAENHTKFNLTVLIRAAGPHLGYTANLIEDHTKKDTQRRRYNHLHSAKRSETGSSIPIWITSDR